MENVTPLRIADVRGESSAQLLSLDGECEWFGCKVQHNSGPVITDAAKGILSGRDSSDANKMQKILAASNDSAHPPQGWGTAFPSDPSWVRL